MEPLVLLLVLGLVVAGAVVPFLRLPLPVWGRIVLVILLEVAAILVVGA